MEIIALFLMLLFFAMLWDIRSATRKSARALDYLAKIKEEEMR